MTSSECSGILGEDKSKIQEFIIEKNMNSIYVSLNMNQILFMISKKLKEKIKFILCQDPYYDKNNKIYTQYFNLFKEFNKYTLQDSHNNTFFKTNIKDKVMQI